MADMEERINRFREMGILEWIDYIRLENLPVDYIPWDGVKNLIRNVLVREAPELQALWWLFSIGQGQL